MSKNKISRFEENLTFSYLFQRSFEELEGGFHLKGKWHRDFFGNNNPIVVELGCGKGEYTVGLAQRYPDRNFIGIDIKGARMWVGCKQVQQLGLKNVAFIRARIELIEHFFGNGEINEIWLTFSDPQPRKSRQKKRLSSPQFLNRYSSFLKDENLIHLKTDNRQLFDYTLEVIEEFGHDKGFVSYDVYREGAPADVMQIQTFYEQMWIEEGRTIHYLNFRMIKNG
ncbi:MAG TPA: tRNA (guanosine(46)-N7)-methyltransferase TrmB [Bacteroidales bacterium]|nr:tRNA (guanosine(46)-N7)-methyltransferase TrmB [Bacteroidales bacterium]